MKDCSQILVLLFWQQLLNDCHVQGLSRLFRCIDLIMILTVALEVGYTNTLLADRWSEWGPRALGNLLQIKAVAVEPDTTVQHFTASPNNASHKIVYLFLQMSTFFLAGRFLGDGLFNNWGFHVAQPGLKVLCSQNWPWTPDPPASASLGLAFQNHHRQLSQVPPESISLKLHIAG